MCLISHTCIHLYIRLKTDWTRFWFWTREAPQWRPACFSYSSWWDFEKVKLALVTTRLHCCRARCVEVNRGSTSLERCCSSSNKWEHISRLFALSPSAPCAPLNQLKTFFSLIIIPQMVSLHFSDLSDLLLSDAPLWSLRSADQRLPVVPETETEALRGSGSRSCDSQTLERAALTLFSGLWHSLTCCLLLSFYCLTVVFYSCF